MKSLRQIIESILDATHIDNSIQQNASIYQITSLLESYMSKMRGHGTYVSESDAEQLINGLHKNIQQASIKQENKHTSLLKYMKKDFVIVCRHAHPIPYQCDYEFYIPQPDRDPSVAIRVTISTYKSVFGGDAAHPITVSGFKETPKVYRPKSFTSDDADSSYYILGESSFWRNWVDKLKIQ